MKLAGQKAIVTGGASGLGKACVLAFAQEGATVFVADKNAGEGRKVARQCGITFIETDVTIEADVAALLDKVEADGTPARILVNCAGIAPAIGLWHDSTPHCLDAFDYILKTNITGTFLPVSRFAYRLRDAAPIDEEVGVIINVSSIAAYEGQAKRVAYAASKGAIASMTLPLARELANFRIRAACIAPGPFRTAMLENVPVRSSVELGTQSPHPARLGKPDEFASLAKHVVENAMINGEIIRLDGALRVTPW